jgi:hypothetical protein
MKATTGSQDDCAACVLVTAPAVISPLYVLSHHSGVAAWPEEQHLV